MTARPIALLTCDSCGREMWGDDDSIPRLRAEASVLHAWEIADRDLCSTCVCEREQIELHGVEGLIRELVPDAFHPEDAF